MSTKKYTVEKKMEKMLLSAIEQPVELMNDVNDADDIMTKMEQLNAQ